jgi:hypothetical protein
MVTYLSGGLLSLEAGRVRYGVEFQSTLSFVQ